MRTVPSILALIALSFSISAVRETPPASAEEPAPCPPPETAAAPRPTVEEFKARIEAATKRFCDVTYVASIAEKSTKVLQKMEPSFSQVYDFKSANISFREPCMLRIEGRLGIVKAEYIVNCTTKTFRAPAVRIKKVENYPDDPAKLQDALDIGLFVPSIWKNRRLEIVEDAEAAAKGEIKLRFYYAKGDMIYYVWLDSKDLWLRRFEKRDAQMNLKARVEYSDPRNPGGTIWMPGRIELYSPEGEKAGAMAISDIKVNTGLSDALFK